MSQRVNIQYSIKLEDLDKEVRRLLDKAYFQIHNLKGKPKAVDVLSLATLREIAQYRESLAEVDHKLRDIMNIINGFIGFQTAETYNVQPDHDDSSSSADVLHSESIGDLEHKLQAFRNSMEAHNEVSPQG